jgi:isoquinoline 1-oxidoreductase beta subunit
MTQMAKVNRRSFIVGSSTLGAGLALGFHVPLAQADAVASPEVNAWVVVKPDETVVIRIARSEMGQGTMTGLAQLVAEELNADWSKVTTEFPTPGQNVARKRVWGDFSTGGSRGIRASNKYVREGGAAARMMLIQAAATAWNVPAAECTADKGVITHRASNRTVTYGQVAEAAGKARSTEGHHAEGSQNLDDRRQAPQAARHRRQARWQDDIRHRHPSAEHVVRGDPRLPNFRRQGAKHR